MPLSLSSTLLFWTSGRAWNPWANVVCPCLPLADSPLLLRLCDFKGIFCSIAEQGISSALSNSVIYFYNPTWYVLILEHDLSHWILGWVPRFRICCSLQKQNLSKEKLTWLEQRPQIAYLPDTETKSWGMLWRWSGLFTKNLWNFLVSEDFKKRNNLFFKVL